MRQLLKRFEPYALLWGLGSLLYAALALGIKDVIGVAVGTALVLINWFVFYWVGRRIAAVPTKSRFMVFLAVKMTALLGIIWLVLTSGFVTPLGLLLGVSSLVFGIFARSAVQVIAEGDAALREER